MPAQRAVVEDPRGAVTAKATLRLRIAETGEKEHLNTIALQRGTGMVVRYYEPPRRTLAEQGFHAVLSGRDHPRLGGGGQGRGGVPPRGGAAGTLGVDHSTDRIKAEYMTGGGTALEQFLRAWATRYAK